jgi:erythromycin esterase
MTRTEVRAGALPLQSPADLEPLLDRIGDAQLVLLGEASHGTHEFYVWRAEITRRLIAERGFSFVAVEGDWPDCYDLTCSLLGAPGAPDDPYDVLSGFDRWPTWMWANQEVVEFARWLGRHNARLPVEQRAGFYGLDVYSLWDSLRRILDYLGAHQPDYLETARAAWNCFAPYAEDPQDYARATRLVPTDCEDHVVELLTEVRRATRYSAGTDRAARFDAEQNALVAAGAEAYYRSMVHGGPRSWNVRDCHMADTLDRLLAFHSADGVPAKGVVWEHNTHVGDARYTDMAEAGMVNVGQLARERHGFDDVVIVGFGTYSGSVIAADAWDAPPRRLEVPPARSGSIEALLHQSDGTSSALFLFAEPRPDWLAERRPHRAIGVVYHPHAERWGNYAPTVLGRRYDAFCWFDQTRALDPLHTGSAHPKETMADLHSDQ